MRHVGRSRSASSRREGQKREDSSRTTVMIKITHLRIVPKQVVYCGSWHSVAWQAARIAAAARKHVKRVRAVASPYGDGA